MIFSPMQIEVQGQWVLVCNIAHFSLACQAQQEEAHSIQPVLARENGLYGVRLLLLWLDVVVQSKFDRHWAQANFIRLSTLEIYIAFQQIGGEDIPLK